MSPVTKSQILDLLSESAKEAAELYSDNPLDNKGRPVTPQLVRDIGSNPHYVDIVKIVLEESAGNKILDVGIAYGLYDVALKRILNVDIYGIDHPVNLKSYCRYPVEKGIPVAACDVQVQSLPYPDDFFDTVIASEIVEHLLMSPLVFFSKLHRVLKPSGKLIITTPNFASLLNIIQLMRGNNPCGAFPDAEPEKGQKILDLRVHPREYTPKEIASSLAGAGFRVSEIQTIHQTVGSATNWRFKLFNVFKRLTPNHREKIVALGVKQDPHIPVQKSLSH
jgi:2-polyprenyl-3-methyl-5-hydroxy-6-metoxy-1,4-benzoquinol methylase